MRAHGLCWKGDQEVREGGERIDGERDPLYRLAKPIGSGLPRVDCAKREHLECAACSTQCEGELSHGVCSLTAPLDDRQENRHGRHRRHHVRLAALAHVRQPAASDPDR